MKYIPIAGTWGTFRGWVIDNNDPFSLQMAQYGLSPLRKLDGSPIFNWPAKLSGMPFSGDPDWHKWADVLGDALASVAFPDLNLLAHSHGGQLALLVAASGLKIRTLTTVATPRRKDIPAEQAVKNIGYWQHLYDPRKDWIATLRRKLGQVGDGRVSLERRFLIRSVQNIGVPNMSHSNLFKNPEIFNAAKALGFIDGIKQSPRWDGHDTWQSIQS